MQWNLYAIQRFPQGIPQGIPGPPPNPWAIPPGIPRGIPWRVPPEIPGGTRLGITLGIPLGMQQSGSWSEAAISGIDLWGTVDGHRKNQESARPDHCTTVIDQTRVIEASE